MDEQNRLLARYFSITLKDRESAILRLIVDMAVDMAGADEGSILAYDAGDNALRFLMTSGPRVSEEVLLGQSVPMGQGVTGRAAQTLSVQTGSPVYKDIRQAERLAGPDGEAVSRDTPERVMAAPMILDEALVGVLTTVSFSGEGGFPSQDMDRLASLAAIAAVVVDQARRLDELSSATLQEDGQEGTRPPAQRIAMSMARIAKAGPQALERLADMVAAVEQLVCASECPGPGEG